MDFPHAIDVFVTLAIVVGLVLNVRLFFRTHGLLREAVRQQRNHGITIVLRGHQRDSVLRGCKELIFLLLALIITFYPRVKPPVTIVGALPYLILATMLMTAWSDVGQERDRIQLQDLDDPVDGIHPS